MIGGKKVRYLLNLESRPLKTCHKKYSRLKYKEMRLKYKKKDKELLTNKTKIQWDETKIRNNKISYVVYK